MWLFHPLGGLGYQFWSGIGSDFSEVAILSGFYLLLRKHNCHVKGCWRMQWHEHPDNGHPVCKHHHPEGEGI